MKKIRILSFLFTLVLSLPLLAQSTNDFLVSGALDIVKSDNSKLFDKAQFGMEVNYFVERRFAVGTGAELWTRGRNSFVLGARWYPRDNVFLRLRGLIGHNDVSLGAGWSYPINRSLRLEAMADLYLAKPDFAIRGGVGYVINYVTGK